MSQERLTYSAAGVDIEAAESALRGVAAAVTATHNDHVIGGIGGFGGLFSAEFADLERPVLVSSIDGVGTKTKVAAMTGDYSGIGADIVNHCANDILCQGARPLFFLDYFGCSSLSPIVFDTVVRSAAEACAKIGCALLGGETAEMPDVYLDSEIDIVGAMTGVVEYAQKLPRPKASPGDQLVGLASSGLHTNGYSLARRALFEVGGMSVKDAVPGTDSTIAEELMRPHKCYFECVWPVLNQGAEVYGVAHVTGGGIGGNLVRVLPSDVQAEVHRSTWEPPPLFRLIQDAGRIADEEMAKTFNLGIGMILVVSSDHATAVVQRLNEAGEHAALIGELKSGPADVQLI